MKISKWTSIIGMKRARKRLIQHHIPLLLISVISVGLMYLNVESQNVIFRLSMATAYPGLLLLAASLVAGPLSRIFFRSKSVSTDFRRDLGLWAAIVSLSHVVFGLQVHMRGRMWLLFLRENLEFPFVRLDMFGAANFTGLIATLILLTLLVTSNDWALNSMGKKKWKQLQRLNYGLFAVVLIHGVLYQVIEKRVGPLVYIFAAIGLIVVFIRIAEFLNSKYSQK